MHHELKTDNAEFQAMKAGVKTFEIRFDDRDYRVGDTLHLWETRYTGEEMAFINHYGAKSGKRKPLEYTGETLDVSVDFLMRGPVWGLRDGWVIMSITVL